MIVALPGFLKPQHTAIPTTRAQIFGKNKKQGNFLMVDTTVTLPMKFGGSRNEPKASFSGRAQFVHTKRTFREGYSYLLGWR